MRARLGLFGTLVFVAMGCKASVEANAKVGGEEDVPDFDKPLEGTMQAQQEPSDDSRGEYALLGARQDLAYRGPATAKCECLSVALGQASEKKFEWATAVPRTNPNTQLVVAISSEPCPAAGDSPPGGSYWGYKADGPNVIVVVENAYEGRPVASGAIIPKPLGDGQVYIEPLNAKVIYGRPEGGTAKRCAVGNPGAPRIAPAKAAPVDESSGGFKRIRGPAESESTQESNFE